MIYLSDSISFFKKLSPTKALNFCKVYSSYLWSKLKGAPVQWGLPFTVSIEPTTACNLKCPECPSGLRSFSRPTGNLKSNFFRKTIDGMYKHMMYMIFYFQGEPYINPEFLDMVAYANKKKIYTITSTNGHFLSMENARKTVESGLDRIIISVDGTTQDVYESYRKEGKLETVLQGARNLVKMKKELNSATPHIIFQFLVVKPNEHQIPEIHRLAKEIGIDEVKLKSAQVYDFENGNPLIPEQAQYSRYRQKTDGTFEVKNKLLNHCWKLWHACVITWDGMVVPCCFDKDAKHQLGDLKEKKLEDVFYDSDYQSFRKQLFKGRNQIDICTNCTEGCKVWVN